MSPILSTNSFERSLNDDKIFSFETKLIIIQYIYSEPFKYIACF